MFKNVLVGVDGRSGGRDAIALASRLLSPGGKLALVHVHSGLPISPRVALPGQHPGSDEESQELLERERDDAEVAADLIVHTSSSPGRGLHDLAEKQGADLIVVGSCSRGVLGRAMLGDDTKGSLNGASCAVAVAARGYAESPLPIATVGIGYDSSPESKAALDMAREIAQEHRSAIKALQVVSIPTYAFTGVAPPALGESIDIMLKDANEQMAAIEGVDSRAVYGLPGEELAAFGEDVDLLVVGSRSYGPVRRLVLGSTSNYLQRHARCSLVVLPRTTATADADIEASVASRDEGSSFPQATSAGER